jgi:purine-nucleoside phosphorylase
VTAQISAAVNAAHEAVRAAIAPHTPSVAVVLGSGLGFLGDQVDDAVRVPYKAIPGFPQPGVVGHAGELIAGKLEGVPVLMQSGRFHTYEGHGPETVALPIRVFAALGVHTVILTNAAGGIRRTFTPGTLMLISDHINMMGRNPLLGHAVEGETRFPDMTDPYDSAYRAIARGVAREEKIALEEGVYLAVLGPSYETKAEIEMFKRAGADAVGMSTVPEVIVARARGMKCVGISTITNPAAGLGSQPLTHQEVLEVAERVKGNLARLVRGIVRELGRR